VPTDKSTYHPDRDPAAAPSTHDSSEPTLDPKTYDWLKKNRGYKGGRTLDAKSYQDWLNSVDTKYRNGIIEFDKCVEAGGSAAKCKGKATDGSSGSSTADKVKDVATVIAVGGTVAAGACELGSGGVLTPVCGAGWLAAYATAAWVGNAYLVYDGCFGDGSTTECVMASAGLLVDGGLLYKSGNARMVWDGAERAGRATGRVASTVGRTVGRKSRAAYDTVKGWF
jgi:hypothetical protein